MIHPKVHIFQCALIYPNSHGMTLLPKRKMKSPKKNQSFPLFTKMMANLAKANLALMSLGLFQNIVAEIETCQQKDLK